MTVFYEIIAKNAVDQVGVGILVVGHGGKDFPLVCRKAELGAVGVDLSDTGKAVAADKGAAAVAGAVFSGGSSLAIAAAIIGGIMAAENVVSTATDGKIGLGALCTKIFGEEAGPWVSMGISLALTAVTMGMGIGAAVKGASDGANAAAKIFKIGTQIAGGVANVGAGITGIGSAINSYNITQLKISNKEMEAMLAKLRQLSEEDTKHLEEVMETQNELVNGVKDVIDTINAAEQAIVTA